MLLTYIPLNLHTLALQTSSSPFPIWNISHHVELLGFNKITFEKQTAQHQNMENSHCCYYYLYCPSHLTASTFQSHGLVPDLLFVLLLSGFPSLIWGSQIILTVQFIISKHCFDVGTAAFISFRWWITNLGIWNSPSLTPMCISAFSPTTSLPTVTLPH